MKWIKVFLFYSIIVCFLNHLYLDITPYLLFHYPFFDFRYLIFVLIQIFWSLLFYQIVYQYLCLDTLIRLRLSLLERYLLLFKKWLQYLVFYALIHIILLSFLSLPIPLSLLTLQLGLWTIAFVVSLVFHNISSYHYISMVVIMIGIHIFL